MAATTKQMCNCLGTCDLHTDYVSTNEVAVQYLMCKGCNEVLSWDAEKIGRGRHI